MYIQIEQLKADANQPDAFLNILPDLTPVRKGRTYRFKESSGLSLYRHQNGTWLLNNFSGKLDVPSGDIWTVTQKRFNFTSDHDGIVQTAQTITAAAGLTFANYTTDNTNDPPPALPKRKIQPVQVESWKPNNDGREELNISGTYELLEHRAPDFDTFLQYWQRKADVKPATLKEYKVAPIATSTTKNGHRIVHSGENFAFLFRAGKNIKRKQPNNKEYKTTYIQSAGNYCFGYDQLPDSGKAVIIAAGESDTLAINDKADDTGIYAICLNSETQTPPNDLINDLRERFDTVTAVYDNDKTGIEQAAKMNAHGIPAAHIGEAFTDNDLCDVIAAKGTQAVFSWLQLIIHRRSIHGEAARNGDAYGNLFYNDPALHHPETFYQFKAKRYIPAAPIMTALQYHNKIVIQAPTGSGKTTAVTELSKAITELSKKIGKRIIYAAPTTAIAVQFDKAARKAGIHTNLVYGEIDELTYMAGIDAPLFVCTYDALDNILNIDISECMLIIDEQHQFVDGHNYRPTALNDALDLSEYAAQTVFLSATPDYILAEVTGYTLLTFNVLQRPKLVIQPMAYTKGNETGAAKWLDQMYPTGKHIVKKDNTRQLKAMAKSIGHRSSLVFSNKDNIKEKPEYEHMLSGRVNEEFIFTTKLLETGVSICDEIKTVNFLNPRDPNEIIQTAARPRMNDGKNETIQINLFFKGNAPDLTKDHEYTPLFNSVANEMESAQLAADWANKASTGNVADTIGTKYLKIRYSHVHAQYVPDTLAIIREYREYVKATSTKGDLFARLQAAGAEILQAKTIDLETIKGEKKENHKDTAAGIFADETSSALGSVKYHTRSRELRDKLKHTQARNDDRAKELKESKELYKYMRLFAHRYIEIKELSGCSRATAVQLVSEHTSTAQYRSIQLKAEATAARKTGDRSASSELYGSILQQTETAVHERWKDRDKPFEISKHKARKMIKEMPCYKNKNERITNKKMNHLFTALFDVQDGDNSYKFTETGFFKSKNENPIKSGLCGT